jgi:hypothetical protein
MSKKVSTAKTKAKSQSKSKLSAKSKAPSKTKAPVKTKAKSQVKTKAKIKASAPAKSKLKSTAKAKAKSNFKTKPKLAPKTAKSTASKLVISRLQDLCVLEGFVTPEGNQVAHPSIHFIDSIAAEYYNKGTLNPGDFGPFSIYCTYADFIQKKNYWTTELITSLVASDHILGKGCGSSCVLDSERHHVLPMMKVFLSDLGLSYTENKEAYQTEDFVELIQIYIAAQSPERQTAFALLHGMLNFDLSSLLLFLSGRMDFDYFGELARLPYEINDPDQWTEQAWLNDIRTFLILTGEDPSIPVLAQGLQAA